MLLPWPTTRRCYVRWAEMRRPTTSSCGEIPSDAVASDNRKASDRDSHAQGAGATFDMSCGDQRVDESD